MGIGTTVPSEKLEVYNGNIKTNYGVSAATVVVSGAVWGSVSVVSELTGLSNSANVTWTASYNGIAIIYAANSNFSVTLKNSSSTVLLSEGMTGRNASQCTCMPMNAGEQLQISGVDNGEGGSTYVWFRRLL